MPSGTPTLLGIYFFNNDIEYFNEIIFNAAGSMDGCNHHTVTVYTGKIDLVADVKCQLAKE